MLSLLGRPIVSKGSTDLALFCQPNILSAISLRLRLQGGPTVLRPLEAVGFDMSLVTDLGEDLSRAELDEEFLRADVLLLPYRSEIYYATGSAMFFEAMDAGIPVAIRSGIGLEREVISHGLGIVFDSPEGLRDGLIRMSADLASGEMQTRIEVYNASRQEICKRWTDSSFENR